MKFEWQGLQDYNAIYQLQQESLLWPETKELVLGLEHPTVITLGRRANRAEELISSSLLDAIPVINTDRGGLATLHSPGQLVIYPLISLKRRQCRPKEYVCSLLKITQTTLAHIGLKTTIDEEQSGLFIGLKKICFVGLRLSEGRAYHGMSINIQNDLNLFHNIRSCGILNRSMTSLHQENFTSITSQELFDIWSEFARKSAFFQEITNIDLDLCSL